jgi:hypothetical protein
MTMMGGDPPIPVCRMGCGDEHEMQVSVAGSKLREMFWLTSTLLLVSLEPLKVLSTSLSPMQLSEPIDEKLTVFELPVSFPTSTLVHV